MALPRTSFPLTGPIDAVVRLGRGSLTVHTREDLTEAIVQLDPRGGDGDVLDHFTVELQGHTLCVLGPRQGGVPDLFGGRRKGSVDVVVEVPSGTALKLSTMDADVTVTGRCGRADVATGSAGITLDTVDGDLRLRYGSGESSVEAVHGSVQVKAGSGSARFGEVTGGLHCGFGSGSLDATVVRGDLRSRSGSGHVSVGAVHGDVDVATGSGGFTLGVPTGVAARLDVTTGSGQLHSDLPVEQNASPGARPITIRARTGSGDVRLTRAA
ncbi:MAG TPA: DUF4097 family beta strand repeat-containing protein [Sporichthyaceae bacterium]|nr:DUF4097 family beta strand repeat-containing protein [Sporichthyaceae bacterium]